MKCPVCGRCDIEPHGNNWAVHRDKTGHPYCGGSGLPIYITQEDR